MERRDQPFPPFAVFLGLWLGGMWWAHDTRGPVCHLESAGLGVQGPRVNSGLGSLSREPFDLRH